MDDVKRRDLAMLLMMFAVFLFASPFFFWWAVAGVPWYLPFAFWGLLIGLTFCLNRRQRNDV